MSEITTVKIKRGNLYLGAELYEKYFAGLESAALLDRDGNTLLMPLRLGAGGGLLMKIMNAKGDRVIHAQEYLNFIGIDDQIELTIDAIWSTDMAGLMLRFPDNSEV